jgi:hypothetical protein
MNKVICRNLILEVGKSIRMNIPNSGMSNVRAHILSIFRDNGEIFIIFKYYSPYRKYWFYRIERLTTLELYNKK